MLPFEALFPIIRKMKQSALIEILDKAITYGMGPALTSENMKVSLKEGKEIIQAFYDSFPGVKGFVEINEQKAEDDGYVEDAWGRKRRLPDAQLPDYEIYRTKFKKDFNPLFNTDGSVYEDDSKVISNYLTSLNNCKFSKERQEIKAQAEKSGFHIHDNGGFKSRAKRQSTNARIQGSAASMTKCAMIMIHNDPIMKKLGFKLLIGVHDELIGECPEENADKCAERLTTLMKNAAGTVVTSIPFKCDPECEVNWYWNTYSHAIQKEYEDYIKKDGMTEEIAFNKLFSIHYECTEDQLREALENKD